MLRWVRNFGFWGFFNDRHVLPSMKYAGDERVQNSHKLPVNRHRILQSGCFRNKDGLLIRTKKWESNANIAPTAIAFFVHGFADHCGRYDHVIQELGELGMPVYSMDLQGHGRSEGERFYVRRFDDYVDDLMQYVSLIPLEEGQKRILIGESMGGLISVLAASKHPSNFHGLALASPWLMLDEKSLGWKPYVGPILRLLSSLFPKLTIYPGRMDDFTKDPIVLAHYMNDPLNFYGTGIKARFIVEAENAQSKIRQQRYARITMPLLILQAGDDSFANPTGSKDLYRLSESDDKTLQIFEGFKHEIFNEPEVDKGGANLAIEILKKWILHRI